MILTCQNIQVSQIKGYVIEALSSSCFGRMSKKWAANTFVSDQRNRSKAAIT
jgi:hypothetical protein